MILDFLYILKDITLFFPPKGILYPFWKLGWQFFASVWESKLFNDAGICSVIFERGKLTVEYDEFYVVIMLCALTDKFRWTDWDSTWVIIADSYTIRTLVTQIP